MSENDAERRASPVRSDDEGVKPIPRARAAPQRPGSPATSVVAKRRAAPARVASATGLRTVSPATVRIVGDKPQKAASTGRRAAPARRSDDSTHTRSASGDGDSVGAPLERSSSDNDVGEPVGNEEQLGQKERGRRAAPARRGGSSSHVRSASGDGSVPTLKQSNSAGSDVVGVDANSLQVERKQRPLSMEISHNTVIRDKAASATELGRTVLNRLEDLDGTDNHSRGRARRGAMDVEETQFRPWSTNKRIFNIMVQVLGASEKDKLMCEKLMRCSHRFKFLQHQEVISKQQEASLKQLELAILAAFDQFLPPTAASS